MKVEIVTFANEQKPMLKNLILSMKKYGYEYKVVGLGTKWINFMTKIVNCMNYIKTLKPNKLVAVVDAYDVLAVRPAREFEKQFITFQSELVIGMESCCFANCVKLKNAPKSKYRNVNGGFYAGYASAILSMYEYILGLGIKDDQKGIGRYVNDYPQRVKLDTETKLVFNVTAYDVNELEFGNGQYYNRITKNAPCFIHMPGIKVDNNKRAESIGRRILGEEYVGATGEEKRRGRRRGLCKMLILSVILLVMILLGIAYVMICME